VRLLLARLVKTLPARLLLTLLLVAQVTLLLGAEVTLLVAAEVTLLVAAEVTLLVAAEVTLLVAARMVVAAQGRSAAALQANLVAALQVTQMVAAARPVSRLAPSPSAVHFAWRSARAWATEGSAALSLSPPPSLRREPSSQLPPRTCWRLMRVAAPFSEAALLSVSAPRCDCEEL